MKLGFVTAILPDLDLRSVMQVAAEIGYQTVEVMCWPVGKAERRYAGVTHIDVQGIGPKEVEWIRSLVHETGVSISGLGYYPNPLSPNADERQTSVEHIQAVMNAAKLLGLSNVNTFVGRHPAKSVDDNWPDFLKTWTPLVKLAEDLGLKIGIENCPMLFSNDEWPGGKNLATTPAIWRRMFNDIPSPAFGLNYDPSHFVWQFIDPVEPLFEFRDRIHHVHAKDARLDHAKLQRVGIMGLDYHTPKIPGLGDVNWGRFFGALTDIKYRGPVCVEVEDRSFEGTVDDRKRSLVQSFRYLHPYVT